jgi:hypothetical protein
MYAISKQVLLTSHYNEVNNTETSPSTRVPWLNLKRRFTRASTQISSALTYKTWKMLNNGKIKVNYKKNY